MTGVRLEDASGRECFECDPRHGYLVTRLNRDGDGQVLPVEGRAGEEDLEVHPLYPARHGELEIAVQRLSSIGPELAFVLARREAGRRLDCPFIFHVKGRPLRDFRKVWQRACRAVGLEGRIVHDLRRSGVKHLISAGIAPHTVMQFSGHRTGAMLKRYHIIALDDLRRAAERGSAFQGPAGITPLRENRDRTRTVAGPNAPVAELGAR